MMSKAKSKAKLQVYNVIGLGPMRQLVKLAKRREKGKKKRNKRRAQNVQESQLKDTPAWRL